MLWKLFSFLVAFLILSEPSIHRAYSSYFDSVIHSSSCSRAERLMLFFNFVTYISETWDKASNHACILWFEFIYRNTVVLPLFQSDSKQQQRRSSWWQQHSLQSRGSCCAQQCQEEEKKNRRLLYLESFSEHCFTFWFMAFSRLNGCV